MGPTSAQPPHPELTPDDAHNRELRELVRPGRWPLSDTSKIYDLVAIGGGTAGLVAAAGAAMLGARVALIERHLMGGDCLVTGCVPSKTLIRSAEAAHAARSGPRFGVQTGEVSVDFSAVMERIRQVRARIGHEALQADGVKIMLSANVQAAHQDGANAVELAVGTQAGEQSVSANRILVATGRSPNIEGLGLPAAGVQTGRNGVVVDNLLRTTNRRIYAAGDVCSPHRFTHTAYAQAEYAALNALLPVRLDWRKRVVPHVTFTAPEVAHVGVPWADIARLGTAVRTITVPLHSNDRLRIDDDERGFARIHLRAGSDRILAATLVCPAAGELIGGITLAMQMGIGLAKIGETIHAYPTRSDLVRKLADAYNFDRLTPTVRRALAIWLRMLR